MTDLSAYIRNPGPKAAVTGLKAAVTTDNAIVTETMVNVLKAGGNAADAGTTWKTLRPTGCWPSSPTSCTRSSRTMGYASSTGPSWMRDKRRLKRQRPPSTPDGSTPVSTAS